MALILSTATGNFNSGATWVGGVVPGVGDEARAQNGHTITITADVTCDEVSNAGTGLFILNNGVTLTANVTAKSTSSGITLVQFNAASPAAATIIGNVLSGPTNTQHGVVSNTSTGTLNITGNVTGGGAFLSYAVFNSHTGTITVTGNVNGGTGLASVAVHNNVNGTVNITGNVAAGPGGNSYGVQNALSGTANITGNVTGGSQENAYGVFNISTGTVNITGNCTGGSALTAHGVLNSAGTVNITGNCIGGLNASTEGVRNQSAGTIIITGNVIGGTVGPGANNSGTIRCIKAIGNNFGNGSVGLSAAFGVSSGKNSLTEVEEIEYGNLGMSPTSGPVSVKNLTTNKAIFYRPSLAKKTLVDSSTAGDYPANSNVRSGTVFNFGNNTGTLAVPAANQVAVGVSVDNTVGTAAITPQNIRDTLGLNSANLDTQLNIINNNTNLIPDLL